MVQTVWNFSLAGRFNNLSQQIVNHPPKKAHLVPRKRRKMNKMRFATKKKPKAKALRAHMGRYY